MTKTAPSGPRILVPLDGSETASKILSCIEPLASQLNARVILLRVVPGLVETMAGSHVALDIATASVREDKDLAAEYLEAVAERMRGRGMSVETIVAEGSPAASILHHLDRIAFVAMTTHSRRGIGRSLLGSVADEVIRKSHIPVLVIHPEV